MTDTAAQQRQLDALVGRMKYDGYTFAVQKNWDGTRDVHSLQTKQGKDLYATLVPTAVVWSDLTGEGTHGSKLPGGGEIDSKGAKYTLTVQCGGEALPGMVGDDEGAVAALVTAQRTQIEYFRTMASEYWGWVWDHADSDDAVQGCKSDGLKQVRQVIAMARKVAASEVPADDGDVVSMARQNFIDSAVSPFGTAKDGEVTLKASQKVFLKSGGQRPPPKVIDVDGKQRNADGDETDPYVMRGMLVTARVRFGAWAFAGRYGLRADLIRVTALHEGDRTAAVPQRSRDDEDCSAFAPPSKRSKC